MIRRPNMLVSDGGNYSFAGDTETMIKHFYDSYKILVRLGIYEKPTDQELIKFLSDLEVYFYGGKKVATVTHKGKTNKDILRDLDL